jgi:hypothetical protein
MAKTANTPEDVTLLGPFVGYITYSSVKLWLYLQTEGVDKDVFVTLKLLERGPKNEAMRRISEAVEKIEQPEVVQSGIIRCRHADLGTGVTTFGNLESNAKYSYQLFEDKEYEKHLALNPETEDGRDEKDALTAEDLYFWTLPEDGYGRQLDFLLMSCHNPETARDDGFDGFAVWNQIPEITKDAQNANVRFAILAGDQIYADEVEARVLNEPDPEKRRQLYLEVYKKFWNNKYYRKVLCRIPAILMWDDHDITDGWGSRIDSYKPDKDQEFTEGWLRLFETAKEMFKIMQVSRNLEPLDPNFATGFDSCFKVGKAGFVIADLRSNRNSRQVKTIVDGKTVYEGRIWLPAQMERIRNWVNANKEDIHTLFFVSSVVFSHGAPQIENWITTGWVLVLRFFSWLKRRHLLKRVVKWFDINVGDLRDDINDSWGSEINRKETDRVLDFLFELQNPADGSKRLNVVILTGDIHTPGYSTIYSSAKKDNEKKQFGEPKREREGRAIIPHIVATPVAYQPFSWLGEAIFRHLTKVVKLGEKGIYTSQVSHHFCYRNVVVVSLRNYGKDESHLKVKYYLEGYPEPQVMLFDLNHGAHRESIKWPKAKRNSWLDRRPEWLKRQLPSTFFPPEDQDLPGTPLDLPEPIPK